MSEDELNQMLGEIGGSCTFDNMLKCFEAKMAGGVNDPDDVILESILCHDEESEFKNENDSYAIYRRSIMNRRSFWTT